MNSQWIERCATLLLCCCLWGCSWMTPRVAEHTFQGDAGKPKSIFVFMDGTSNDLSSNTNVQRIYELVANNADLQSTSLYIEGVGGANTQLIGMALGIGMKKRILMGYDFIARHYAQGDAIYLFGFSRGGHEARALAGLISYAGLPLSAALSIDAGQRMAVWDSVLDITRNVSDIDFLPFWKGWHPGQAPPLASELLAKLKLDMRPARIEFVGLWDTVPGSWFKTFGPCREEADRRVGDRYKSDSYPTIKTYVHAVSADEKRSRFAPLLVCQPLNPQYTEISQKWFPGSHSDIGGGYQDDYRLSLLTLSWMRELLQQHYALQSPPSDAGAAVMAMSHWSVGDSPGNWFSHCEDRVVPPGGGHPSIAERASHSPAEVRINGKRDIRKYPLGCADM